MTKTTEAPPSDEEQAMLDDLQRVLDEYNAAVPPLLAARDAGEVSAVVKMRADRAQTALQQTRAYWREIGQAVGNRTEFIAAADNSTDVPSLIEGVV